MQYELFDGLALSDVLRDTAAPKPFRLFRTGENRLTKNGRDFVLTLTAEQIAGIAEYQRKKGEKIPIDSRHALLLAANESGISESEAARQVNGKVSALGYAALEARPDGLYAVDLELLPLAGELFREGALRYWSPVIRGRDGSGPLRVTSIAMDNVPALNDLDILAAGGETNNNSSGSRPDAKKGLAMTKTEEALNRLFGEKTLALGAETDALIASKLEALAAELPELRKAKAERDTLALAAESSRKNTLIADAIAKNKITNAQKDGLLALGAEQLKKILDDAPEGKAGPVPVAPVPPAGEAGEKHAEELTPEEKEMARRLNCSDAEFIASKKKCGASC